MAPGVAQGITALNEYASVNKIVCHKPTMMEIVQAQGGAAALDLHVLTPVRSATCDCHALHVPTCMHTAGCVSRSLTEECISCGGKAQVLSAVTSMSSKTSVLCAGKLAHKGPCHYVTAPGPGCDPLFQVTDLLICLGCVERHFNPPCTLHHGCATKYIPDPAEERLGKRCPRCAIMDGSWLPPAAGALAESNVHSSRVQHVAPGALQLIACTARGGSSTILVAI